MIDLPTPIYIEYKNLSSIVAQSEHQKDFIALALKKIEGQSKLLLEKPQEQDKLQNQLNQSFFWEAKCITCHLITENNNGIILSSIKKSIKNNGIIAEVYFDTADFYGKVSSWKVEIAEVKPIVVRSGDNVKINYNSINGISIHGAGKSLKNAIQGDVIRVQVKNWFAKNTNLNSTEIIEAKVIAPYEVEYVDKQ